MARTWYGWVIESGELAGVATKQKINLNSNRSLRAIRTWFIGYNSPVFTGLQMKIYSNYSNAPLKLLHTSTNSWSTADVFTNTYGLREIYFEFNYPHLKGADDYWVVLTATSYTGSDSSHLSWLAGFPEPIYSTGITADTTLLTSYPRQLSIIGAETT